MEMQHNVPEINRKDREAGEVWDYCNLSNKHVVMSEYVKKLVSNSENSAPDFG